MECLSDVKKNSRKNIYLIQIIMILKHFNKEPARDFHLNITILMINVVVNCYVIFSLHYYIHYIYLSIYDCLLRPSNFKLLLINFNKWNIEIIYLIAVTSQIVP